jgi:hypothetical protein
MDQSGVRTTMILLYCSTVLRFRLLFLMTSLSVKNTSSMLSSVPSDRSTPLETLMVNCLLSVVCTEQMLFLRLYRSPDRL